MNDLQRALSLLARTILRTLFLGFLFTSGGLLALNLFSRVFKLGICP